MKTKTVRGWTTDRPNQMVDYGSHELTPVRVCLCSATRHRKCVLEKECMACKPTCEHDRRVFLRRYGKKYHDYKNWKRHQADLDYISKILKEELSQCHRVTVVVYPSKRKK